MFDDVSKEGKTFISNFSAVKGKKLVLYGTGRLTERLLPMIRDEFDIVALMDSDETLTGSEKYGLPIISLQEAEEKANIIIINTAEIYWNAIYERMIDCNMPIYYTNGCRADEKTWIDKTEQFYKEYSTLIVQDMCQLCEQEILKVLVLRRFFENVCSNYQKGEQIVYSSAEDYGYCLYGPIILTFFIWLINKANTYDLEELLFPARDGYLLIDEYREFIKLFELDRAPRAKYIAGSRRMILVAGICDEESFKEVAAHTFSGTFAGYMKNRFSISVEGKEGGEFIILPRDEKKVFSMMQPYMQEIQQEIESERKDYLRYLKRQNISKKVGVVDTGYSGRLPYHLGKLLQLEIFPTFYWYGDMSDQNIYNEAKQIEACFQENNDVVAKGCQLEKHRILNESIFTAPYGMMQRIKDEEICYMEQDMDFEINEEINNGIKRFLKDASKVLSKQIIEDSQKVKEMALWADGFFGEVYQNTKLSSKQQDRIKYSDGWFGNS